MVLDKNVFVFALTLLVLFSGSYAASSATSPAKIVNGLVSDAVSIIVKWLLSLKTTTKTAISGRPMMKFESGYTVETVFDGSKLGIEPYTVEVLSSGDLLVLDSANSNLYKISSSLSQFTRPKLVAGSAEGYYGHIDGKLREARMNHPKGLTVDDRGNIYVADTTNTAIRKISDSGVTTIAGGKWGKGGGHVDGRSEDAKFSSDFDVVYVGSSCSLLVIDRGYKAIREIQLPFDDCAYQYNSGFPLGIAVLLAAGFFGYMLALLQRRVGSIVSSQNDQRITEMSHASGPYQKPLKLSLRPPLIPNEDEQEKQEEGFIVSLRKLISNTGASAVEILGGIAPGLRKKHSNHQFSDQQEYRQEHKYSNTWPVQDSFVIPDEDEPPSIDTRTPTPRKTYPFMSQDVEKMQQFRQSRKFYSGLDGESHQQQPVQTQKQQQHHHRHFSSTPETYYEQSAEKTNEIVFGAVQEQDKPQESVVIKPLDYGNTIYDRRTTSRSRINPKSNPYSS